MKTRKYLALALTALSLGVTGCNDEDFLKEKPETIYTLENSFNTVDQVQASVDNQYQHIRYWFQNNFFLKGIGADYLDAPGWRCGGGSSGTSNFAAWSSDYGTTYGIYEAMYMLVAYCNQTLDGIAGSELTYDNEAQKNSFIAQSRFFRGFAYLTLGELFGGVPVVTQFYETPRYDFTRSSREETYQQAIDDLTYATENLPQYPSEAGRVAQGAANHYLAEAYLALATIKNNDKATLDKAIGAANKAMSLHALMTERFGTRANPSSTSNIGGVDAYYPEGDVFFDLFQAGNLDYAEGNTEALWTLQNDLEIKHEYGGDQYLSYPRNFSPVLRDAKWKAEYAESGANASPWNGDIDNALYPGGNICAYVGGKGVSFTAPTDYVINEVWKGKYSDDMRNSPCNIRRQFVCLDRKHSMYGKVVSEEMISAESMDRYYPIWTKFAPIDDYGYEGVAAGYDGSRDNMYRDDYACRLAETYLLRAEAYLRAGDKEKAAADINALRKRAKCAYEIPASEVDIHTVLDERARELFFEERRWCTLLRMESGVAAEQLKAHAMYVADYPVYTGVINWNLFPFPQAVIDSNTGNVLDQNAGW